MTERIAPQLSIDHLDLLRVLTEHQVRFMIIGGYAVIIYTKPRYTKDLDLFVEYSESNLARIAQALAEFGLPRDLIDATRTLKYGEGITFGRPPNRADILTDVSGVSTFDDAWARTQLLQLDDISIPVMGPDDLMAAKTAAGRDHDLIDLKNLQKLTKRP